jgi:hypothetical protein
VEERKKPPWRGQGGSSWREIVARQRLEVYEAAELDVLEALVARHITRVAPGDSSATKVAAYTAKIIVERQVTVAKPEGHCGSVDLLNDTKPHMRIVLL